MHLKRRFHEDVYLLEKKSDFIYIRRKGQHNIHLQEWETGGRNKNSKHILILGRMSSTSKWICYAASNTYY